MSWNLEIVDEILFRSLNAARLYVNRSLWNSESIDSITRRSSI